MSDAATCQTLIGSDGGLVSKSAQFLAEISDMDGVKADEAMSLAEALKGVADTSSEQLRALLTVMQEPFRDLADAYHKGEDFNLKASRFKAAGNEVVVLCEPALQESIAPEAGAEDEAGARAEAGPEAGARAEVAESSAKAEAAETASQRNALRTAESYLEYKAFSRTGLISQLKYEGYSTTDATWAVDRVTVDWNEQAAKAAERYLEYKAFSRTALIDQLVYEGFSPKQSKYGVSQAGL